MATKARIENGIVREILTAEPFPPFHPDLVWVECGAEVREGWTWDGKTFEEPPGPSDEETRKALTDAMQSHLDQTAQSRGYDGILSLCSYATSANARFGPEGQAGVTFRDAVWAYGYQIIAEVQAGTRPVPSAAELVAALPSIVWPS